ncbi:MAG: DUF3696 domain-containing protein [Rhodobacteraceae bacterium]|nr:DUF3696 domain-containing protein [Paracoccaceae bacterium]
MIEFINVKNFKSLLDTSFPLGPLNLFSGLNGMGKSTLIQSLLLLRQSHERNTLKSRGLLLNGEYLKLGTGQDVLSSFSDQEKIGFILRWKDQEQPIKFEFQYKHESDLQPYFKPPLEEKLDDFSLFNSKFQYLCADRLGPQRHHQFSEFHINDLKSLGQHGEYTVHFIAENGSKNLSIIELKHPNATSNSLLSNIEAWMSELTPGVKINVKVEPGFGSVSLGYSFIQGKEVTEEFKPQNVGFGLSYVLPIVTSILCASKGDLLIFENPESHLHPAGHSLMGKLCVIAAKKGVQLIIESHSDHLLNGIRVEVKNKNIDADDIKIFFLNRDIQKPIHASEVMHPSIDDQGRIDFWPDGFFDQWDKDLDQLL